MGAVAAIGSSIVGGVAGAIVGSNAAGNAADQQQAGATAANQVQDKIWQEQQANNAPYMQAGTSALSQMQDPSFQHNFSMSDFQADPGYAFRLQQGQQALERSAAARGGLQSAGTLKDLTQYGQDMASNEFQNAYSRFTNDQNNRFGRLSTIAGMGQAATNNTNALGSNYAANYGNNLMGAANAKAAGTMAQGQIWGNTLSSLGNSGGNYAMQSGWMNKMYPGGAPSGGANPIAGGMTGMSDVGSMGGGMGGFGGAAGTMIG